MAEGATQVQESGKTIGVLKHLDKIAASSTVILLFVLAGFYYNTNSTLINHSSQLKELKTDVSDIKDKISDAKFMPMKSNEEIKSMKELIGDIKEHQQKTDDRLDKIYDLLIDINNKKK